jgi:hypothetical protein
MFLFCCLNRLSIDELQQHLFLKYPKKFNNDAQGLADEMRKLLNYNQTQETTTNMDNNHEQIFRRRSIH